MPTSSCAYTRGADVCKLGSLLLTLIAIVSCLGGCPTPEDAGGQILDPNNTIINSGGATNDASGSGDNGGDEPDMLFELDPREGSRGLTVQGRVYTVAGEPVPSGDYLWKIENADQLNAKSTVEEIQSEELTHTFTQGGRYIVTLSLTLGGLTLPIGCGSDRQATVVVRPTISGYVYDEDGAPLADVVLSIPGSTQHAVTNAEGAYTLEVGYDSSGVVTPELTGVRFLPEGWSFAAIRSDIANVVFRGSTLMADRETLDPQPQELEILEDQPRIVTLRTRNEVSYPLVYVITELPTHGTLVDTNSGRTIISSDLPYAVTGTEPRVTYTPNQNNVGTDEFIFGVRDPQTNDYSDAPIDLTIMAVNDPPSFIPPTTQYTNVNLPISVTMTNVLPGGGPDEAYQQITFSAHSSNQSIVPDANLQWNGAELTLSATHVGGPATITVTAHDNGGSANGGVSVSSASFAVYAVAGPLLSGLLQPFDMAGTDAPLGPIQLLFSGTGSWAGTDLTATTDPSGQFQVEVPTGWTGVISAAEPENCLLSPAELALDTPITNPTSGLDFQAWIAPIGIPTPSFGVFETHWMYAGATYDFGSGPEPYPDAGDGPYTHYIDNTHPNATDSNNPYGTPTKPRLTIPATWIPAGSVLEIHGGSYTQGARIALIANGTADKPVFVRGVGTPAPCMCPRLALYGHYLIVENIRADRGTIVSSNDYGSVDHVAIRHAEMIGSQESSGFCVANWGTDAEYVSDVLLWDVDIHDMGDINANFDQDFHGLAITSHVSNCWLLDSRIHTCSGSGLQVNASSRALQDTTHHIYAGRNLVYDTRQSGLFTKQAVDVIFSQNEIHDIRTTDWSPSKGLGYQYAPERVWFLFNRVYNCEHGVFAGSDSGLGYGENIYIIGNVLSNIHTASAYNPNTAWSPAAIMLAGGTNRYIINNTIYDADAGINGPGTGSYFIINDIISEVTLGHHVFVELGSTAQTSWLGYSILHQSGGDETIRWGSSTVRTVAGLHAANPTQAMNCSNADPRFVGAASRDFQFQADSPAIDAGLAVSTYQEFYQRYGVSISYDAWCVPRGMDGNNDGATGWDIGASERR